MSSEYEYNSGRYDDLWEEMYGKVDEDDLYHHVLENGEQSDHVEAYIALANAHCLLLEVKRRNDDSGIKSCSIDELVCWAESAKAEIEKAREEIIRPKFDSIVFGRKRRERSDYDE